MSCRASCFVSILYVMLVASPNAFGDTIVSLSGTASGAYVIAGAFHDQILESSWTTSVAYRGVNISIALSGEAIPPATVSAFLTTAIGPSETASNQIAATTVSTTRAFPAFEEETVFSGLTLQPGTYYLVLGGGVDYSADWWGTASSAPTIQTDSGVSYRGDGFTSINPPIYFGSPDEKNPPDSVFLPEPAQYPINLIFSVTGTRIATPEPKTLALTLVAFLFFILRAPRNSSFGKLNR